MITGKTVLCAQKILIDKSSNNASAINILDQLNPEMLPFPVPELTLLVVLERELTDPSHVACSVAFTINGKKLLNYDLPFDFADKVRCRSIVACNGLPVPEQGILQVTVRQKQRKLGAYGIAISSPRLEASGTRIDSEQQ